MNKISSWAFAALCATALLSLQACTDPAVDPPADETGKSCESQTECGPGFACDIENRACEPAYTNGLHGVSDDTVVIGASAALTGIVSELSTAYIEGVKAYLHHINQSGGVHGRQIEYIEMDDQYVPDNTVKNVTELIGGDSRKVFALLGNVGSPTTEAIIPLVNQHQTVLFAPYTGSSITRQDPPDRYVFNLRTSYEQETEALSNYLLKTREPVIPPQNIMVVAQAEVDSTADTYERLDAYGAEGFAGVAKALKDFSGVSKNDVFFVSYKRGTANVDDALSGIVNWVVSPERARNPEGETTVGIVMQMTTSTATPLLTDLKDIQLASRDGGNPLSLSEEALAAFNKVNFEFVATSPVGNALPGELVVRQNDTKNYCDGLIITQAVPLYTSGSTAVTHYREQLAAYNSNLQPGFASLEGYLTARVFVEALEIAGPDLTDDVLVEAIESINNLDIGLGTPLNFSPTRHQALEKSWSTSLNADCEYIDFDLE